MPVIQGIVDCMSSIQSLAVWTLARNWNARNEGHAVLTASLAFSRGWGTAVWTLALRTIVGGGGD